MANALDRLRRKKPNSRRIPICMDPALVAEVDRLQSKLFQLQSKAERTNRPSDDLAGDVADVSDELEAARAAAEAESEWFLVSAIAPDEYTELIDAHKPTPDQSKRARKENGPRSVLPFNVDTFPNALIAACVAVITPGGNNPETGTRDESVEPLTLEFVEEMRKSGLWNSGEVMALFNAATMVNQSTSQIDAAGNA